MKKPIFLGTKIGSQGLLSRLLLKSTAMLLIFLFAFPSGVLMASEEKNDGGSTGGTGGDDTPVVEVIDESAVVTPAKDNPLISDSNDEKNKEPAYVQEDAQDASDNPLFQMNTKSSYLNEQFKQNIPGVDTTTGALSYQYSVDVPPGRNGVQPDLKLTYNNQDKGSANMLGVGWSLNIPYIQRLNKTGSEKLYTDDHFTSSISGELALVSATPQTYRGKVENGDFTTYVFANNKWTATDKSGTVYKFGQTSSTQLHNPSDTNKTFKWMLEEVRDSNGNYVRYEYEKDGNQIYPSGIVYTGKDETDGIFDVVFTREERPDTIKTYNAGFQVSNDYRISEIKTEINGSWTKKYSLAYATSTNGGASLLTKITESGRDESGAVTELPSTEFTYQMVDSSWEHVENASFPVEICQHYSDNKCKGLGTEIVDVNGDGLVDVIRANDYYPHKIYLNTGSGWALSSIDFPDHLVVGGPISGQSNGIGRDLGTRLADLNGDGLVDIIRADYSRSQYPLVGVYINNGNGWDNVVLDFDMPDLPFIAGGGVDGGTRLSDINGDGLPDYLYYNGSTHLNIGYGFDDAPDFINPQDFVGEGEGTASGTLGVRPIDINNDGLTDIAICIPYLDQVYVGKNGVYYNKGDGTWFWDDSVHFPDCINNDSYSDSKIQNIDLNQDDFVDVQYAFDSSGNPASESIVLRGYWGNGGTSWPTSTPTLQKPLEKPSNDTGVRIADLNGDGMLDQIKYKKNSPAEIWYKKGGQGNILTKIKNEKGGEIMMNYKNSPLYKNADNSIANPHLPLQLYTVEKISVNDGFATTSENTYRYASGTYYYNGPHDRKFAGFGEVDKTDALGNVTKSYFHQGNSTESSAGEYDDHISKMGKPYRIDQYDVSGNLFSKTINKWDYNDLGTGTATSSFVKLVQTLDMTYDGDSDHKDKAESYAYNNNNGNLTEKISYGEVTGSTNGTFSDTGSDLLTTALSYAASSTSIMSLPSREFVTDQSSATVRDTKSYYDGLSFGYANKGNATKQEMLKTGSTYIDVEKTYNSHGLVTEERDPLDNSTEYSYDTYNIYPTTTTNALGHTTTAVYDYSLGKPKQITDQNDRTFAVVYDGLDRVTEEKQPDTASPSTLVTKTTYAYTDDTFPTSAVKTNYLNGLATETSTVSSYAYFDGLGRAIQERARAEDANTYSVKDTKYNLMGQKSRESLPYFSTGSSRTTATGTSALWNNFTYDAVGRIKEIGNVVGTTTNAYDDWKLTVTDANGKSKDLYKDAQGNLVRVDEHNGASTYSTYYEWNKLGNLTKITDALGNVRSFTYDKLGRRLTAQDLHNTSDTSFSVWTHEYDNAGNMTLVVDGKNQTIEYVYDDLNRTVSEDFSADKETEISYAYDSCANGVGKLCFATTTDAVFGDNVSSYTYDALGRTASETKAIEGATYQTSNEYDRAGNQTLVTTPDGAQVKYEYNAGGMVEKIARKEEGGSFVGVVEDFDYSPEGKITYQNNHNETATTNTYDAGHLYRLTGKFTDGPMWGITNVLQDLHYTYDSVGNVTQLSDISETNNSKTILYSYDDLSRLTMASSTAVAVGPAYKETYTYDAIGNMLSKSGTGSYSYATYSSSGGALFANPHAVVGISRTGYTYDKNGNMLESGNATSTWNYKNQMIELEVGNSFGVTATTTLYAYDHTGERVINSNGVEKLRYPNKYWNVSVPVSGGGGGGGGASATTTTSHIFLGDMMVATVEKVGAGASAIYYIHTDHLSGANISTDAEGLVSEITDFYPYGKQRLEQSYNGNFKEQRKFTGHEYDQDTSLLYMGSRYQNPNIGRFTSLDPVYLGFDPNTTQGKLMLMDPQLQNSYSYARNNPLVYTDPDGEFAHIVVGALIGGAIGGLATSIMGGNMQQTLAAIAGGAVAGATFAAAGPAGLAETMGAGVISNVAGSSLTRGLSGESVDGHTALMDAGVGAAGGALGFGVNKAVSGIVSVFNTKSAIKQIGDYAADHAYGPHIQNPSDDIERVFATNFSSKGELSSYVQKIIKTTPNNNIRQLGDGRTAFWDDAKKAVIIYNAPKPHRSSVYSPSRGRAYFEDLD